MIGLERGHDIVCSVGKPTAVERRKRPYEPLRTSGSKYNSILWNSGIESNKDLARSYKRKLTFISNIYVIKDNGNPDNDGKVFLFKYGKKIFDKITSAMKPEFADEEARNPFDLWEGMNFRLRIRQVDGYRNYDKSEFDQKAPLLDNDAELEKIWKQCHSLQAFLDAKEFKSYDELKTRLDRVLGLTVSVPTDKAEKSTPNEEKAPAKAPAKKVEPGEEDDDDESMLKLLKNLAEDDD